MKKLLAQNKFITKWEFPGMNFFNQNIFVKAINENLSKALNKYHVWVYVKVKVFLEDKWIYKEIVISLNLKELGIMLADELHNRILSEYHKKLEYYSAQGITLEKGVTIEKVVLKWLLNENFIKPNKADINRNKVEWSAILRNIPNLFDFSSLVDRVIMSPETNFSIFIENIQNLSFLRLKDKFPLSLPLKYNNLLLLIWIVWTQKFELYKYKGKNIYYLIYKINENNKVIFTWSYHNYTFILNHVIWDTQLNKYTREYIRDTTVSLFMYKYDMLMCTLTRINLKTLGSIPYLNNITEDKIDEKETLIGALDLETTNVNNKNIIVAIGVATFNKLTRDKYPSFGKESINYMKHLIHDYLPEKNENNIYDESVRMFGECMTELIKNYKNYNFYVHNLSNYDSIYILKYIEVYNRNIKYKKYKIYIKPIYYNKQILKLEVRMKINNRVHKIMLLDSMLIMNTSLSKLAKTFNYPDHKHTFPHDFINKDNNIFYNGTYPSMSYFNNISIQEYNKLIKTNNNIFNTYKELDKYLKNDVILLLYIMEHIRIFAKNELNVKLYKCMTISRLALTTFKENYFNDYNKLPAINKQMDTELRKALHGGFTTVLKPHGLGLFYYDINSFYPFCALNDMPGKKAYRFTSHNPLSMECIDFDKYIGILRAKVTAPKDLHIGLLPTIINDEIHYPIDSTFEGDWTSMELLHAKKYGYEITLIEGYLFEKIKSPFTDYINKMYNFKETSTGPMRSLYKSLLNNLIGRFALKTKDEYTAFSSIEVFNMIENWHTISEPEIIGDWIIYNLSDEIMREPETQEDYSEYYFEYLKAYANASENMRKMKSKESSIAITIAVNAYARIYLTDLILQLKAKGYNVYYTDTDSIVLDKELSKDLIGTNLGQFKLEYHVKEGYFISNKLYYLETYDGTIKTATVGTNKPLTKEDYISLWNNENVETWRSISSKVRSEGYVRIMDQKIILTGPLNKREKIYNNKNEWIDTRARTKEEIEKEK